MRLILLTSVVLTVPLGLGAVKDIPSYVKLCRRNDPQVSKCWQDSIENLRPHLVEGIPEFNLPPIDPLLIPEVSVTQDPTSSSVNFKAVLTNVELREAKNFQILDAYVDFEKLLFAMKIHFPHLILKSDYRAEGKVLTYNFDTDGNMLADLTDIVLNGTWIASAYTKKGDEYVTIAKEEIDLIIGKLHVNFDDIIRGNPALSKTVNTAINDNIDLLYSDVQPVIQKTLGIVISEYVNRAFAAFPADVLSPRG